MSTRMIFFLFISLLSSLTWAQEAVNKKPVAELQIKVQKDGGKCFRANRPAPPPAAPPPAAAPPAQQPPSSQPANPVPAFQGKQSGIGSWFVSNAQSDSTNGNSWCGYPYHDYSNGFAPDLSQMRPPGVSYEAAAKQYCGLEAIVTDPSTGNTRTMYIIDAFDPKWVRSPGSIDIMKGAWTSLHNQAAVDKNVVIQGVQWQLTGKRSSQYCFKCSGR